MTNKLTGWVIVGCQSVERVEPIHHIFDIARPRPVGEKRVYTSEKIIYYPLSFFQCE
ncbi:hypothetical protein D3C72_1093490 [compost metagenome]